MIMRRNSVTATPASFSPEQVGAFLDDTCTYVASAQLCKLSIPQRSIPASSMPPPVLYTYMMYGRSLARSRLCSKGVV
jgi:hypothetical protein